MVPSSIRPDAAHTISLYGVDFRYGIGAAESDGALSMLEVTIPPRTLIKPHMHTREDEYTLILSGSVGARLGEESTDDLPAGSWLVKPRAVPHAMWNVTDQPARILEVVAPGGLERYFEAIAPILRGEVADGQARYAALAVEFGLTILDDWTEELEARYGITL